MQKSNQLSVEIAINDDTMTK